jgi:hypothetical protein
MLPPSSEQNQLMSDSDLEATTDLMQLVATQSHEGGCMLHIMQTTFL